MVVLEQMDHPVCGARSLMEINVWLGNVLFIHVASKVKTTMNSMILPQFV